MTSAMRPEAAAERRPVSAPPAQPAQRPGPVADEASAPAAAVQPAATRQAATAAQHPAPEPLFAPDVAQQFQARWHAAQASFVDDPAQAVEQADQLVSAALRSLGEGFARERDHLQARWRDGGQPSTEDLRVALRRYRSFFDRLLSL